MYFWEKKWVCTVLFRHIRYKKYRVKDVAIFSCWITVLSQINAPLWNEGGYLVFVINIFSVLYVNCFKKFLKKKYFNSETTHSLIVINKSIQVIFIDLFPLKKISKNWINKQLVGNFNFQAMFIIYEVHRKLIYLLTLVPLLQV